MVFPVLVSLWCALRIATCEIRGAQRSALRFWPAGHRQQARQNDPLRFILPVPLRRAVCGQRRLGLYRGTLGRFVRAAFQQRQQFDLSPG